MNLAEVLEHNRRFRVPGQTRKPGEVAVDARETSAVPIPKRPVSEADLHDKVEAYCRANGWYYIHPRMDCRSTIAVGCPDFAIFMENGRNLFLELKRPGGKATPDQLATIAHLRKLGHVAAVVDNWADALLLLK